MAWTTEPEISGNELDSANLRVPETASSSLTTNDPAKKKSAAPEDNGPAELMVCQGAKCTCDQAVDPSPKELKVLSHHKYIINEGNESKLIATTQETDIVNLNFEQCKMPNPNNPSPCTAKLKWKDFYDHVELPNGAYVLTEKSTAICTAKGGNIKIIQHGQQAEITAAELEKANAAGWAATSPLMTESDVEIVEEGSKEDTEGAKIKSVKAVEGGKIYPVNTAVKFTVDQYYNHPTEAEKKGINWIVYDKSGLPVLTKNDVGELVTVGFKTPGTYMIEAFGHKAGDKTSTLVFQVKENELSNISSAARTVRINESVNFSANNLFPALPLAVEKKEVQWTVTKLSGEGNPSLLHSSGTSTQVICASETVYVVSATQNGKSIQSEKITAQPNRITGVHADHSSLRINETVIFTVKDYFKITPANTLEKGMVKWKCVDIDQKEIAAFSGLIGDTVSYKFEQPGKYSIMPYLAKPSDNVKVIITVTQPRLIKAQWEYPEGGGKDKTGMNEPNRASLIFEGCENLVVQLSYGFINSDGTSKVIKVIKGIKIGADQVIQLKDQDFIPGLNNQAGLFKEGDVFFFKIICTTPGYTIENTNVNQPLKKLRLLKGESVAAVEFSKGGKRVYYAQYGDQMSCLIRSRNLSTKEVTVSIYRKEVRSGYDLFRKDTNVHTSTEKVNPDGTIKFNFVLDKAWQKSYDDKLHNFYIVIKERQLFGDAWTLAAFKSEVPANGGTATAQVEKTKRDQAGTCFCKEHNLYWGNKISCEERKKVYAVAEALWGAALRDEKANQLMSIMHVESAGTFSPSVDNGVGYSGLIQFSDGAAKSVGTTRSQLVKMSFIEQMDYVQKYFAKKKDQLNTITDLYLLVLKPNAVGKGNQPGFALFDESISVPDVPFDKNNISKEPWVTKYGYSSNPAYMTEKGEREKRKKWVYTKQAYAQRPGFEGGKTTVSEVESVLKNDHYNPGKANLYVGDCINITRKVIKTDGERTPWMKTAIAEASAYGGKEEETIDTRIRVYHKDGGSSDGKGSATAWCSSFVCWCIQQKGFNNPRSAGSRFFLTSSQVVKCEAFYGAVAIFSDCDKTGNTIYTSGHATFVYGKLSNGKYALLGGNQNDMLKITGYDCSGNVFLSYTKNKVNHYKKFRGFYKPTDYTVKPIDQLNENDIYSSNDSANLSITLTTKTSKNGESSR